MSRIISVTSLALVCVSISFGSSAGPDSLKMEQEKKASLIEKIKKPAIGKADAMRDMWVYHLSMMRLAQEDPKVVSLFVDLIERDKNEWVRLEAAADIHYLRIPKELESNVYSALVKARSNSYVNFKVLSSISVIQIKKKRNKEDSESIRILSSIAKGEEISNWKIMVPKHNIGAMVEDPTSKRQVPIEEILKIGMRTRAIEGLRVSNDKESRTLLTSLENDENIQVKAAAKFVPPKN